MNLKEKRIRILDLQDQHCQICEYQMKPLKACIQQHCEIGKELKDLAIVLVTEEKGKNLKNHGMLFVNKRLDYINRGLEPRAYPKNSVVHVLKTKMHRCNMLLLKDKK
ncbi:hypothetical protein CN345_11070 [Bacillus thuringiensis]|nr:hypothetical protein CN345_11070 [Bacillus thuringiensis]PGY38787.1 hypothetical protein COE09_27895 [Bacillus thuringiensis]